ncbi:hypothetical protein DUNSADRAFT_206 [Dunaliella salina]|uniref:Encoded protein n=1 Tax=Dunaliella salina TaxID=3046 RepID=A0ABQ7GYH8_DUNSA|nr:hypothetical protein DUNSADRAFT_206 [Dunaliella salina]|eukprot:KAF5839655.1 hypothetical protein DUNSADRAFT_206 [Dunaliella salina]
MHVREAPTYQHQQEQQEQEQQPKRQRLHHRPAQAPLHPVQVAIRQGQGMASQEEAAHAEVAHECIQDASAILDAAATSRYTTESNTGRWQSTLGTAGVWRKSTCLDMCSGL